MVSPFRTYGLPALAQLLIILILSLPTVQWMASSQTLWLVPFDHLPRGQLAYLFSKLVALYALAVFALQLAYGIAGTRARALLGFERGLKFHRALGLTTLSLLLIHASLFILGAFLRTGHFPVHFALPSIVADYYVSRIALGWWAGVALILAALCAIFRAQIGRWWRVVHWLSIPAAAAAAIHSLSVGTESRMPVMLAAYACMALLLFVAFFLRLSVAKTAAASQ
jgi:predicted ferric reductase